MHIKYQEHLICLLKLYIDNGIESKGAKLSMKIIIVEDEIKRLEKVKIGTSDDAKVFYDSLISYLKGSGTEVTSKEVKRILSGVTK